MASSPASGEGGSAANAPSSEVAPVGAEPRADRSPPVRAILRVVVTVVLSAFALYLVYLLRTPISYLVVATFVAVSVAAPVNILSRRMPRGIAILLVYLGLVLIPIGIGAILIPPAVQAASDLVTEFPGYVDEVNATISENERLRDLNDDFDITGKLEDAANDAAGSLDDAAATLADVGAGLLGSLFGFFTVMVLSMFMVGRGGRWAEAALRWRPPEQAEATRRALERMALAVSSYVGGELLRVTIAGVVAFIVLSILGMPAALALAVVFAIFGLIPLIGATIGSVVVGLVTLFVDFPTVTIVWSAVAIAYQQFENYVIQPRIQSRAVELDPFIIIVAVLFGGFLLGVIGALLAIPVAAAAQIGVREYLAYRGIFPPAMSEQEKSARKPGDPLAGPGVDA